MFLHIGVPCAHPLPRPLGEVAERSEDGEGKQSYRKALSVTCGDSSPKGRAKGGAASGSNICRECFCISVYRALISCLSLWERWPSAARTGRANIHTERPSQSPAVTALPKGEPRGELLPAVISAGNVFAYRCPVRSSLASPLGRGGRAKRGRRGYAAAPKDPLSHLR